MTHHHPPDHDGHHHHETHDEAILYHQHVDTPDHGHEWITAIYNNGGGNFDHDVDYFGPADHTHHDEYVAMRNL